MLDCRAMQSRAMKSLASLGRFLASLRPKLTFGESGEPSVELDFSSGLPTTKTRQALAYETFALADAASRGTSSRKGSWKPRTVRAGSRIRSSPPGCGSPSAPRSSPFLIPTERLL